MYGAFLSNVCGGAQTFGNSKTGEGEENMKIRTILSVALTAVVAVGLLTGCEDEEKKEEKKPEASAAPTSGAEEATPSPQADGVQRLSAEEKQKLEAQFASLTLSDTLKEFGLDTPVMTQRLGADPYAIVYDGRVYLYMTGDVVEYDGDGKVKDNSYGKINTLNVISSADLVNWTDHGTIYAAGMQGASKWGKNSWAPAVAYKEIDGKTQFFIYFANGGNGIGVLTSDSPTGPFVDPLGKALISRNTPNCDTVTWLFDPAVLVDEDGSAYLYFGGGIPEGMEAAPGTGRVVKLGDDMISLDGEPQALDIPYLFEDSGINRIGDTYYYSYCTNWNVTPEATEEFGFASAQIAYMTSDDPMGPFTLAGVILKNPGNYYGCYGNNHHCLFQFHDEWYIAYHTQMLEKPMGISGGYRATSITKLTVNEDGSIPMVPSADRSSLVQIGRLDPYDKVEAETMATMGGLNTTQSGVQSMSFGSGNMELCDINSGDWLALYGVDFGSDGAKTFTAAVKAAAGVGGAVQLRLDGTDGEIVGYLQIAPTEGEDYQELTAELLTPVTGEHDLVMVFSGEGYTMDYWRFGK